MTDFGNVCVQSLIGNRSDMPDNIALCKGLARSNPSALAPALCHKQSSLIEMNEGVVFMYTGLLF